MSEKYVVRVRYLADFMYGIPYYDAIKSSKGAKVVSVESTDLKAVPDLPWMAKLSDVEISCIPASKKPDELMFTKIVTPGIAEQLVCPLTADYSEIYVTFPFKFKMKMANKKAEKIARSLNKQEQHQIE
jgi:hypothetical protein